MSIVFCRHLGDKTLEINVKTEPVQQKRLNLEV